MSCIIQLLIFHSEQTDKISSKKTISVGLVYFIFSMELDIPLSAAEPVDLFIYLFFGNEMNSQCWLCAPVQLRAAHMCCWLLACAIAGYFMHQLRVWSCRDNRSSAATCNMWPRCLPGSPVGRLHYSLLNAASSSQTDVQVLMFNTCH